MESTVIGFSELCTILYLNSDNLKHRNEVCSLSFCLFLQKHGLQVSDCSCLLKWNRVSEKYIHETSMNDEVHLSG